MTHSRVRCLVVVKDKGLGGEGGTPPLGKFSTSSHLPCLGGEEGDGGEGKEQGCGLLSPLACDFCSGQTFSRIPGNLSSSTPPEAFCFQ